jgi:hypothetical protein
MQLGRAALKTILAPFLAAGWLAGAVVRLAALSREALVEGYRMGVERE